MLKLVFLNILSGILYGTLTMEYGGKVSIECEKTGYRTEIEFKLKVRNSILKCQILQCQINTMPIRAANSTRVRELILTMIPVNILV